MPAQPTTPIVDEHDRERRLQRGDERDEQQQRRKRERDVGEAHHELVDPLAVVAGDESEHHAERQRDALRDEADRERHARAVDEPRPHVAALDVGAEPVLADGGCSELIRSTPVGS